MKCLINTYQSQKLFLNDKMNTKYNFINTKTLSIHQLCRGNPSEPVYAATTGVVRCVMRLAGAAAGGEPAPGLLRAVRAVGAQLRDLCATVDALVVPFPTAAQRYDG